MKSEANPKGTITNSDLELAGLVLLWLMMEHVCGPLIEKRIALFSNNSPTVSWIERMACRSSLVAEQLIRVLALRFNIQKVCPITTLHIAGDQNSMTNIPSRMLLGSCGSGPLPPGYQLPKADPTPIRFRSTSPNRLLWQRKTS